MGKATGFLEFARENSQKQAVGERIQHYKEFDIRLSSRRVTTQAARCMDCGVPFCNQSCGVSNLIPEFNDYVFKGKWLAAYGTLQSTNNFPEFTGRVCPAPCESSCCADLVTDPVSIKQIELAIIEKAFKEGWVKPNISEELTGKKIAIIGSGPAGLAAAAQLNVARHSITVFEKNEVIGGLLALGIPDFKLEKNIIDRRVYIMKASGVEFRTNAHVGQNISIEEILKEFDYVCLTGGSEHPRDLPVPGRELEGVEFAMDFLTQQNRRVGNREINSQEISAKGKNVVVIGGGDTGSDCVGTSIRQGAKSVTQIEILPKPPLERPADNPWPEWPRTLRTSSSHEEGCLRDFNILTEAFVGQQKLEILRCARVEWDKSAKGNPPLMKKIVGSEYEIKADLVLLALGFVHPIHEGMLDQLAIEYDAWGNIKHNNFKTTVDKVFTAGDMASGQSLVLTAINSGRAMAKALDVEIKGFTHLS